MNYSITIANRFREVILDGTWIANTNYKKELTSLDWQVATTKVDSLNTISLLAQHVHYYISGVKDVVSGGPLAISDQFSFDFPPIASQEQWEQFLNTFWRDSEDFAHLVENTSEEQLRQIFVEEKYNTYLRNIEAMIEHSYYHLGQIILIKKMIRR
ncbi:DUF1572 domain-containing protein [Sphingobacterium olei]|uniref:DUF1572 domain-containing protein n=1 Tax=Sphingobacterium olei TaxID=2571155 RepID=A0A4U0NLT7_9SPHI|nr:DUF1572 family protein [Sphingobacterium olei]TJZ54782.1 DUF1572 domain-containing protein [Sphingobacterium olei]